MSTSNEKFLRPGSLDEALRFLAEENVAVLGGGTYMVARQARSKPRLVDLGCLDLGYIIEDSAWVKCGAMARVQELVDSTALRRSFQEMLGDAARATRPSWMLRNMSSIGGELIERSRHSAIAVAMLALDAEVMLATIGGERRLSLDEFYRSNGAASLSTFLLIEISIPKPHERSRLAFRRLSQLPSQQPIVTTAMSLTLSGEAIDRAGIALGSAVKSPQRLHSVEQALTASHSAISEVALQDLLRAGLEGVEFARDYRTSAGYLREVSEVLIRRTYLELLRSGR